jgi:cyclase
VELMPLADGLYLLSGLGGNITIAKGSDGLLMVDSGLPTNTAQLKAKTDTLGLPVEVLINTHWHADHSGSNVALGEAGTRIIAHENTAKRLAEDNTISFVHQTYKALDPAGIPRETFRDGGKMTFSRETLEYKYFPPAHTDGDSTVHYTKAGVFQTGDLFFNGIYPFIDYSTGGSIEGMVHDLGLILNEVDESMKIIPGHGPLAVKAELKAYHDMLSDVSERISKIYKSGKTVDQALAAAPTKKHDERWGKGFMTPENFVKLIYQGKSGQAGTKAS